MMSGCEEYFFDEIVKLEAIPESALTLSVPMNIPLTSLNRSVVSVVEDRVLTVIHESGTIKASAQQNSGTMGRTFTADVQYTQQEHNTAAFQQMGTLSRNVHHLRLTTLGGKQMLVLAWNDGYKYTADQSEGKYNCRFTLRNMNGILDIVD